MGLCQHDLMKTGLMALIIAIAGIGESYATSPLAPPEIHSVESANAEYLVVSDPVKGTTCVRKETGAMLWENPKWYRMIFISNDGKYLVTSYDGMNLIPTDSPKDLVLVTIFTNGKISKEFKLMDLIPDVSILSENMNHYDWGGVVGFDDNGTLKVRIGRDQLVVIDPKNGTRINQEKKEGLVPEGHILPPGK